MAAVVAVVAAGRQSGGFFFSFSLLKRSVSRRSERVSRRSIREEAHKAEQKEREGEGEGDERKRVHWLVTARPPACRTD